MKDLQNILLRAAELALEDDYPDLAASISDDFNLFEAVDSFGIVNVLLESEGALEKLRGSYLALADESVFDASKSPFLRWQTWVSFVEEKINGA